MGAKGRDGWGRVVERPPGWHRRSGRHVERHEDPPAVRGFRQSLAVWWLSHRRARVVVVAAVFLGGLSVAHRIQYGWWFHHVYVGKNLTAEAPYRLAATGVGPGRDWQVMSAIGPDDDCMKVITPSEPTPSEYCVPGSPGPDQLQVVAAEWGPGTGSDSWIAGTVGQNVRVVTSSPAGYSDSVTNGVFLVVGNPNTQIESLTVATRADTTSCDLPQGQGWTLMTIGRICGDS